MIHSIDTFYFLSHHSIVCKYPYGVYFSANNRKYAQRTFCCYELYTPMGYLSRMKYRNLLFTQRQNEEKSYNNTESTKNSSGFFSNIGYNIYTENLRFQEYSNLGLRNQLKEWGMNMNLAKISANGQITVPIEIRKLLGLKSGDKILFFQNPNGEIVIGNASAQAIRKAQTAFTGVAEEIGVYNDDDVQSLVDEVRYGKDNR